MHFRAVVAAAQLDRRAAYPVVSLPAAARRQRELASTRQVQRLRTAAARPGTAPAPAADSPSGPGQARQSPAPPRRVRLEHFAEGVDQPRSPSGPRAPPAGAPPATRAAGSGTRAAPSPAAPRARPRRPARAGAEVHREEIAREPWRDVGAQRHGADVRRPRRAPRSRRCANSGCRTAHQASAASSSTAHGHEQHGGGDVQQPDVDGRRHAGGHAGLRLLARGRSAAVASSCTHRSS